MRTVRDLVGAKGRDIWSVRPTDTVYTALQLMAERNVGAVLVIDHNGALVGVLSERDYARKVVLQGQTSRETLVADIMTDKVICISDERTIEEAMGVMTSARIRHLPVMHGDQLIGVVSIGDIGKAIMSNQGFLIEQLEKYICAR